METGADLLLKESRSARNEVGYWTGLAFGVWGMGVHGKDEGK